MTTAGDEFIRLRGHDWHPKELSVCMAYDALRLSLGGKPSTFTPAEIVTWLSLVGGLDIRKSVSSQIIREGV